MAEVYTDGARFVTPPDQPLTLTPPLVVVVPAERLSALEREWWPPR
jgi:hypothetical protein